MHGFSSRVTLSFLFLSFFDDFLLFFLFSALVLSVPPCYLCLLTYCIYNVSPPRSFIYPPSCHCNLYQQSRCLNNASKPPSTLLSHSSSNHLYSFSTRAATIVSRHRRIRGKLGDKKHKNPLCLVVMPDSNTKSHNSKVTRTPMYYKTAAVARFEGQWRRLRGPSRLCSLHFKCSREHVFFSVAMM